MIELNNVDIEFPQINRESIYTGYSPNYIEKTMLNRSKKRVYFGQSFVMRFSYPWLTKEQENILFSLIELQKVNGSLSLLTNICPNIPSDSIALGFDVFMDLNAEQQMFKYNDTGVEAFKQDGAILTNWQITLTSIEE